MQPRHISQFLEKAVPQLPSLQVADVKDFIQMKLPPRETLCKRSNNHCLLLIQ
jgi:hypothetical protein